MKAITTKILPDTGRYPARIKAFDMDGNTVTVSYQSVNNGVDYDTHEAAAFALCDKMKWPHKLIGGPVSSNTWAWVFLPHYEDCPGNSRCPHPRR